MVSVNDNPLMDFIKNQLLVDLDKTSSLTSIFMAVVDIDSSIDSHMSKYLDIVLGFRIDIFDRHMVSINLMCHYIFTVKGLASHRYTGQH